MSSRRLMVGRRMDRATCFVGGKLVRMGGRFLPVVLVLASAISLRAADGPFVIELSARADGGQRAVTSRSSDAATPARLSLAAQPRRRLEIKWVVAGASGSRAVSDVTVHVFLERASAAGPANAPKPGPNALYESAVVSDFASGTRSTGQVTIEVPDAGDYVLRVETIGGATSVPKQAAAIDLAVTP